MPGAVLITRRRMPSLMLVLRDLPRGACASVGAVLGMALLLLAARDHVFLAGVVSAAGGAAVAALAWRARWAFAGRRAVLH